MSPSSPRTGMAKEAYPIKSITIQNSNDGDFLTAATDDKFFIISQDDCEDRWVADDGRKYELTNTK